jgi:cystine transport system substrate-binding protein
MRDRTKRCLTLFALVATTFVFGAAAFADDGSLARVKSAGKLTIGAEGNWVPYVFNDLKNNNVLTGFEVDVAKEIARRLGVKAEFNISNKWDGVIAGLDAKRYDTVICGVTPNPDRQGKYNLSVAYAESPVCLVVAKGNSQIKDFEDLKGKLCANSLSSSSGNIARSYGARLSDCNLTQAMDLLVTGRADAHVNNLTSITDFMAQKPDVAVKVASIYKPKAHWEIEEAVMIRKDDSALAGAINTQIKAMIADGTCYKLAEHYFGKTVADSISIYRH